MVTPGALTRTGGFGFFGGDPPEDPFNSDNDFQGTWTLDGDRIELMVEDRGQLMLQISLADRMLTITQLCNESLDFYSGEELAECRANPTQIFNRASLLDL